MIAVVHSDTSISNLLVTFLEDEGYLPVAYNEYEAALERLCLDVPDLVIVDLGLSSIHDEQTLVDQLRADPVTRHIPIIALTTANDPESVRPASCTHNCEMLPEPFDLNSVQGMIRSLLRSPQHCRRC